MLKKTVAFILVLSAIVSILASCTLRRDIELSGSDSSETSSSTTDSVSHSSKTTSSKAETSRVVSEETSKFTIPPGDLSFRITWCMDRMLENVDSETFGENRKEADLAKEFPEELAALVSLGEDAVRILINIYNGSYNSTTRRALAWYIATKIKPELSNLVFENEKHSIECSAYSVIDLLKNNIGISYDSIKFVNKTNSKNFKLTDKIYYNIKVDWSPTGDYAAISHNYSEIAGVYNGINSVFLKLPDKNEMEKRYNSKLSYTDDDGNQYNDVHFGFREWTADNKIKIYINLANGEKDGFNAGWYIFDLSTKAIVDSNIKVVPDIASKVYWYFDVIFATNPQKLESEIAEDFAEEFAALVAFGEEAFPALDDIINKNDDLNRCTFSHYVKYTIKPQLYDLSFSSPDGKYTINCSVNNFSAAIDGLYWLQYDNVCLVEKATNKVVVMSSITDSNINVSWKADSKYAAVSYGYDRYYINTDIFDVQNLKFIKMPDNDEVSKFLNEQLTYNNYYRINFKFKEWLPDNKVKIGISTSLSDSRGGFGEGWYIYDLKANKIVDGHYEITEQPSE